MKAYTTYSLIVKFQQVKLFFKTNKQTNKQANKHNFWLMPNWCRKMDVMRRDVT